MFDVSVADIVTPAVDYTPQARPAFWSAAKDTAEGSAMLRISTADLSNHVGKLVQVRLGGNHHIGTLRRQNVRSFGRGDADATWLVQARSGTIEFRAENCEIYSMQYEPLTAWRLRDGAVRAAAPRERSQDRPRTHLRLLS